MMTPPELYQIWCKYVPAGEAVDRMTVDQFLAAAADIIAALQVSSSTSAKLSPAAQAVLDGFRAVPDLRDCPSIAGALRAVADQVLPADKLYARSCCEFIGESARAALLTIADELEASEVTS